MTTSFNIISNSLFTSSNCLQYLVRQSDSVMKEHIHLVDKYQCFRQRCCLNLPPWRWEQYNPLKCIYLYGYRLSCISRLIINNPGYENLSSFDTLLWIRPSIMLDLSISAYPGNEKKLFLAWRQKWAILPDDDDDDYDGSGICSSYRVLT